MTFSEKILKKGRQEGIKKGIKKGSLLTLKRLYEKGIITKEAYLEEIEKLRKGKLKKINFISKNPPNNDFI